MKKLVVILGVLAVSCCRQAMPIRSESKDSVRVEYKTEYAEKIRIDTVRVPVPAQSAQIQIRDSSSHLETDFAESDARIGTDGTFDEMAKIFDMGRTACFIGINHMGGMENLGVNKEDTESLKNTLFESKGTAFDTYRQE